MLFWYLMKNDESDLVGEKPKDERTTLNFWNHDCVRCHQDSNYF